MKARNSILQAVMVVVTMAALCFSVKAEDCADTVVIDSVAYAVPDTWCRRAVDSVDMATPEDLVQLPQELTFEEYRIYVRREARDAFVRMAEAAKEDSVLLTVDSGFRSKGFQRRLIKRRLDSGETFVEILKSVAPPGYSEHHTGRAFDMCPSDPIFADTDTYQWLAEHAERFGFFETLPDSPDSPWHWEPWHWLYRPTETARPAETAE
ncbi:hypothetical protein GF377_00515 [candidate division GN15 bacterium]|nr:hypothetical protein [candidate division GN15 bacterium]